VLHELRGRVALVTGAGSPEGIGFACARTLRRDGATVVLTSTTARIHDRAAQLASEGTEAKDFVPDLTDRLQSLALIDVTGATIVVDGGNTIQETKGS
jgi:3-oxoacyl-[acyl-carrier protein] reductase